MELLCQENFSSGLGVSASEILVASFHLRNIVRDDRWGAVARMVAADHVVD
jgi:hypothetical protein